MKYQILDSQVRALPEANRHEPEFAAGQLVDLGHAGKSSLRHVPAEFSLLSWNLNKQCYRSQWPSLFRLLQQHYPAEFILFQELNYRPASKHSRQARTMPGPTDQALYHSQGYHFTFLPNLRQLFYKHSYAGVATLSSIFCDSCNEHTAYISRAREPLAFTPKPMLASTYGLENGQLLLLINIHAINFVHTKHFVHQLAQLRQILQQHQGPAILAGDFNSWHSSRIRAIEQMLAHGSNAFTEADFGEHSQHIKRAPRALQYFFGEHHLDRVYYDSDYLALDGAPKVLHQVAGVSFDISDHAPLYVRFRCRDIRP